MHRVTEQPTTYADLIGARPRAGWIGDVPAAALAHPPSYRGSLPRPDRGVRPAGRVH